jgi:uncharacterized membrane protein
VQSVNHQVIWGAILVLAVAAVLLVIFGGTVGGVIVAVAAIALSLFASGRRRA